MSEPRLNDASCRRAAAPAPARPQERARSGAFDVPSRDIIRFPEGQILWQGGCDLEGKDTSSGPKGANAQGPKSGGLKETFDLLADTCADQLVAQFMGKEGDK